MPGGAGTPGGYGGGPDFGGGEPGGGYTGRPAPHRDTSAQRAAQAALDAAAAQRSADALNAQRAAQQAAEGRVDLGFQEVLRKQKIQQDLDNLEDLDDRSDFTGFNTAPIVDIRDIQGEVTDPDSGSYNPLLTALDDSKVDEGFKRYIRQVQQPIAPTPKSGIGTTLKNIALGVLAPQLLAGTALAKPYNLYRQYQTAKRLIPKIGDVEKTIRTALTRTPTTMTRTPTTGTRKITPLVDRDRDRQRVKTVAEQVATGEGLESGAKLLGVENTQKAELFRRKRTVENILREGSYQGRNLTSGQRDNLMNYIEQINKFLVPVQQGI